MNSPEEETPTKVTEHQGISELVRTTTGETRDEEYDTESEDSSSNSESFIPGAECFDNFESDFSPYDPSPPEIPDKVCKAKKNYDND